MSEETLERLAVSGATITVKAGETPSEQIVKAASQPVMVTDDKGRVITLKKPNPLANLDFAKAAGANGLNQLYLMEVAHLKFVSAIDGVPVATPTSEGELRALYARLGDEGNEAAQTAFVTHFVPKSDADRVAELKN